MPLSISAPCPTSRSVAAILSASSSRQILDRTDIGPTNFAGVDLHIHSSATRIQPLQDHSADLAPNGIQLLGMWFKSPSAILDVRNAG
ncbi:hypothetical protein [Bradyrhizobium erythrophlei]|uniref:hypothetical protein n=1 Tax=Bradyrhizobium erythrophlei TaxID=1437360 RepID=UPI0012AB7C58|nr:hypothetical protein [Bradyrhizobium erythrophlei]